MAKKNAYQKSSLKDQEGTAKEIAPKTDPESSTDLEFGSEFPYNSPEQGMNKKQQQQKKQ